MAPRAQTLKQAKAAYKSRNQNTLSEREKKQLERSIELERRAWRARESEKRKAEARTKREERERKGRDDTAGMTSQRRCDRFGFLGSQMHLGAFFGGGGGGDGRAGAKGQAVTPTMDRGSLAEDDCFDIDLDDESILEALGPNDTTISAVQENGPAHLPTKLASGGCESQARSRKPNLSDVDLFWDDLETSTQIARDLASDRIALSTSKLGSPNNSFSSGDFDISVEDIEEAHPRGAEQDRNEADKELMPPPALPGKFNAENVVPSRALVERPLSTTSASKSLGPARTSSNVDKAATTFRKSTFAPYLEFTTAELESFIDDDLQLTQIDPV